MTKLVPVSIVAGVAALLAALPAAALVELQDQTQATFQWSPADGPVAGYKVYVSRNEGEDVLYSTVAAATQEVVEAAPGDTVQVSVSAFDTAGREGPRSARSETVLFGVSEPPPEEEPLPEEEPPPEEEPLPEEEPPPAEEPPAEELRPAPMDFDGDGFSDLLLRHRETAAMRVLALNGSAVVAELPFPSLPLDVRVVGTHDYDGDGIADVLCAGADGQVELLRVEGGAVVSREPLGTPLPESVRIVGSGDFDGDGDADVLARDRWGGVAELWYLEAGRLLEVVEVIDAPRRGWWVVGTKDLDGDGVAEVVWHHRRSGRLLLWRLAGDRVEEVALRRAPRHSRVRAIGDLDGDGASDFLVSTGADLTVARFEGDGLGPLRTLPASEGGSIVLRNAGDFDGDGDIDLLLQDGDTEEYLFYVIQGGLVEAIEALPALQPGWFEAGVAD